MRRRAMFLVSFFVFVPAVAGAQADDADVPVVEVVAPLPPETPIDRSGPTTTERALLQRWLDASPEVAAWRTELGASRFDVVTATLLPNPTLSLSTLVTQAGQAPDSQINGQIQISQPLPIFGQIDARRDEALAALRVSEVNVATEVWQRASDLRAAIVARAFADARSAMLEQNLGELDRILTIVGRRSAAGASPRYDTMRVQLTAVRMRAELRQALLDRRQAEAALLSLLAVPGLEGAAVTREGLSDYAGPDDLDALVALALARRPDAEQARRGAAAARASAARQRAEVVPTPTVWVGSYVGASPYGFSLLSGVAIPVPLFDQNQGDVGHDLSQAEGYDDATHALEERIRVEVTLAHQRVHDANEALALWRTSGTTISQEVIRMAEVSYEGGRFLISDLFDAYEALWDARDTELSLERELADAQVELARAAALFELPAATGGGR